MAVKRTAAPNLRERNRARTHSEIAEAALTLFERNGYDDTTVEQIAASAQVSSATFFRYFASKEDVLFAGEEDSAAALIGFLADRPDRSVTVAALAEPILAHADWMLVAPEAPMSRRLTRLVMTTPSLEPRSLRLRLRWERDIAHQLASEAGRTAPDLDETTVAAVAVSCLTSALRHWRHADSAAALQQLVARAFEVAAPAPRSPGKPAARAAAGRRRRSG